jgi:hypothetical protein
MKAMWVLAGVLAVPALVLLGYTAGVAAGAFPPPWFALPSGQATGVAWLLLFAESCAFALLLVVRFLWNAGKP